MSSSGWSMWAPVGGASAPPLLHQSSDGGGDPWDDPQPPSQPRDHSSRPHSSAPLQSRRQQQQQQLYHHHPPAPFLWLEENPPATPQAAAGVAPPAAAAAPRRDPCEDDHDHPVRLLQCVLRYRNLGLSADQLRKLGPHLDRALRRCPPNDAEARHLARRVGMWRALQRFRKVASSAATGGRTVVPQSSTRAAATSASAACRRPMWEWLLAGRYVGQSTASTEWERQGAALLSSSSLSSDDRHNWMQLWPLRLIEYYEAMEASPNREQAAVDGRPSKRARVEAAGGHTAPSLAAPIDDRWKVALVYLFYHWAAFELHTRDGTPPLAEGPACWEAMRRLVWDVVRDFPRTDLLSQAIPEAEAWYALDNDGPLVVDDWKQRWLDKLSQRARLPRSAATALLLEKLLDRYCRNADPALPGAIERLSPPEWEFRKSYSSLANDADATTALTTATAGTSSGNRRRGEGDDTFYGYSADGVETNGGDPERSTALHPLYPFRVQLDAWLLCNRWTSAVELAVALDQDEAYAPLWLYLLQRGDLFRKVPVTESPLTTLIPLVTPHGLCIIIELYRTLHDLAQADSRRVLAPDERNYVVRNCRDFLRVLAHPTQTRPSADDNDWQEDDVPASLRMEREHGRIAPNLRSVWDRLNGMAALPAPETVLPDAPRRPTLAFPDAVEVTEAAAPPASSWTSTDKGVLCGLAAIAAAAAASPATSAAAVPYQAVFSPRAASLPVPPDGPYLPPEEDGTDHKANALEDEVEAEDVLGEDSEEEDGSAVPDNGKSQEDVAEDGVEREPYESDGMYDSTGDEDNPIELGSSTDEDEGEVDAEPADVYEDRSGDSSEEEEHELPSGVAMKGPDVDDDGTDVEEEDAVSVDEDAPSPSKKRRMSTDQADDGMSDDEEEVSPAKSSTRHETESEPSVDGADEESANIYASDEGYQNHQNRETEEGYDAEDSQEHSDEDDDRVAQQASNGSTQGDMVHIVGESMTVDVSVSFPPPLPSSHLDPGYEAEDSQHTDEEQHTARRPPPRPYETGYDAEDSQGHTEEEEEVIQSDDDDQGVELSEKLQQEVPQSPVEDGRNDSQPHTEEDNTFSDMSAADEATEDQGAESSELEDVEAASSDQAPLPVSPGLLSTPGQAISLGDYARSAMSEMPTSQFRTRPSARSYLSAASDMATGGATSQAASLESGDELDNCENKDFVPKAVVDHVPDELVEDLAVGKDPGESEKVLVPGTSNSMVEVEIRADDIAVKASAILEVNVPGQLDTEALTNFCEPHEQGTKHDPEVSKVAEKENGAAAAGTILGSVANVRAQLSAPEDMVAVQQSFADESTSVSPVVTDELNLGGLSPPKSTQFDLEHSSQKETLESSFEIRAPTVPTVHNDPDAGNLNMEFEMEAEAEGASGHVALEPVATQSPTQPSAFNDPDTMNISQEFEVEAEAGDASELVASEPTASRSPTKRKVLQDDAECEIFPQAMPAGRVDPDAGKIHEELEAESAALEPLATGIPSKLGEDQEGTETAPPNGAIDTANVSATPNPVEGLTEPEKVDGGMHPTTVDNTAEQTPGNDALPPTAPRTRSRGGSSAQSELFASGVLTRSRVRIESTGNSSSTRSQLSMSRPSRRAATETVDADEEMPRTRVLRSRNPPKTLSTPVDSAGEPGSECEATVAAASSAPSSAQPSRDRSRKKASTPAAVDGPPPSTRRSTRLSSAATTPATESQRSRRSSRATPDPDSRQATTTPAPLSRQSSGVASHTRSHDQDPPSSHTRNSKLRRSARKAAG